MINVETADQGRSDDRLGFHHRRACTREIGDGGVLLNRWW